MSAEQNKRVIRGLIDEIINKGDMDAAGDYIAEDVIELAPFPGDGAHITTPG
jgi:hypothetical protein